MDNFPYSPENLPSLKNQPFLDPAAWVAPGAFLIGDVHLSAGCSVWFGAVLRADLNPIRIGERSNVQDGAVIHLSRTYGVEVGAGVSIGHRAVVHACKIGNDCLIGMGAIIMDGAEIGEGSLVAAGALVPKNMVVPPGSLVLGTPAAVRRPLTADERKETAALADKYVAVTAAHIAAGWGDSGQYPNTQQPFKNSPNSKA
jgi:carbonic anhydrase/acetyltransferase-like protein (isoleucine patch superfamily)